MPREIAQIARKGADYATALSSSGISPLPDPIWAIGDLQILQRRLLGFFCSAKCPFEVILRTYDVARALREAADCQAGKPDVHLRTYDVARALREAGVPVIGGFHSPLEKECLELLLRGKQPIGICPARAFQRMRIPTAWRVPIDAARLLILSPFEEKYRRATVELGEQRNRFVAALATDAFVAHAGPGSKTERLSHEILESGKQVRVLDVPSNQPLIASGAVALRVDDVRTLAGSD